MRSPLALGLVGLLLVTVVGCADGSDGTDGSDGPPQSPTTPTTPTTPASPTSAAEAPSDDAPANGSTEYVALGDSYAAAPGVPPSDPVGGCFRSGGNYASLLATDLDLQLSDQTCSGATTGDVIERQVPAIGPGTRLVTLGVGGNDADLFVQLVTSCVGAAVACSEVAGERVAEVLPTIERNVGDVLDAVQQAAPDAQVVVVGYPDLLPERGECPDRIPLAAQDFAFVDGVVRDLSGALRRQAERRDLDFVDVYAASQGHDICADDPWVNGVQTSPEGVIPLHPLPAEQRAVADLIAPLVR
ncbi:SGNH/GDSL hydrolase family protein [Nocardioides marinquilinus]|uniref:SGNH/GDSL hydrolase family protein n=1 Tax=Nocardioides marinquilinus TaxID=1210400 RepID=A0ABP9P5H0_9ACTN